MSVALIAAAFGMVHVTRTRNVAPEKVTHSAQEPTLPALQMPYRLMLSDEAEGITIDPGNLHDLAGTIDLDPENPTIFLTVQWKSLPPDGAHRFAKLTLEPAGKPTIEHVFDAPGDIDDLFELPLQTSAE
ncbi:hypothetical protein JIN85_00670 [Luteolibacter pohnpeiensis]|uniref:Uncharacterized protein n=1 Tax=Luteolibacter pohnpeiensis TaxID=454153 RepID=A0A934S2X3_9BACT|nr:hypothetical protein [Luteolibacter pohnpeiensis]MBK1880903.1 hypothetical protein [Luteolibacter pohnpeiensis]